jgi:tetratricopeptide (TPR) repeat protein
VVGTSLWFFVLRSQPFPSATAPTNSTQATAGGSTLPQNHPQVTIPENVKKSIEELVAKANANPQDLGSWKALAEVQFRASQVDSSYRSAALSSYRHVLELAPNDLEGLRGTGNVYYDLEEYPKAVEYYQKYLTLSPDDPNVRTDLATMYLYSKDVDRAITEYQAVIAKKPDFMQAYFNLGIAYHEKGETEKARATLEQTKALTTDQNVQARIDKVITELSGSPAPTTVTTPATKPDRSPFQQAVEQLFRGHEIMGPRLHRIEWPTPAEARVFFQNFPMAAMPPDIRERFLSRLRTDVTAAKKAHNIESQVKVELVDADTQQVMATIETTTS